MSCAISAATGQFYPKNISRKMADMKFDSYVWLTEKQLKLCGVGLAESQKEKYFPLSSSSGGATVHLYNASQTENPEKVAKLVGRLVPVNVFSNFKIRPDAAWKLTASIGEYEKSEWLTLNQINALGLKLKEGAKYVCVEVPIPSQKGDESQSCLRTVQFYNVAELADPSLVSKMKNMLPISAHTGRKYQMALAMPLLQFAIEKGLDSPFWLTAALARELNLHIRGKAAPARLPMKGLTKEIELYNASQTNDPNVAASYAYRQLFQPRSALSGSHFPRDITRILSAAAMRNKYHSIYWLTKKQAVSLGVHILPGHNPTEVKIASEKRFLFNADQTNNSKKIEDRFS
ncbi:mitochondrial RNA binding protein [Perkinsela sp. CCAP 1560/4]|nr:mitochondrial RNA binding protein [Perkinsela sp. CCAP 1560/4]|eukprot:KNH08381.1 mitochondrial RNA binding protein [Perkinsela sp. CCAP 1560/4]